MTNMSNFKFRGFAVKAFYAVIKGNDPQIIKLEETYDMAISQVLSVLQDECEQREMTDLIPLAKRALRFV